VIYNGESPTQEEGGKKKKKDKSRRESEGSRFPFLGSGRGEDYGKKDKKGLQFLGRKAHKRRVGIKLGRH